jgi:death-on-curing protein
VSETEYLDLEDLLSMTRALGIGPVRDLGLLDSTAARPRASAFTEDAYPTIELKAAALLHSLARNHPLVDGNKRLSWLAVAVFFDLKRLRGNPERRGGLPTRDGRSLRRHRVGGDCSPSSGLKHVLNANQYPGGFR